MIFRSSNNHIKTGEYLTGKAHPTVFEGSWIDTLKMVRKAHALKLDTLPPAVKLKVVAEDRVKAGVDYFDPTNGEVLCDTSAVIARIFRGKDLWRKMTVSAEGSRDLNGKALKFEWKVLRGDPQGVKITPQNATGSVVDWKSRIRMPARCRGLAAGIEPRRYRRFRSQWRRLVRAWLCHLVRHRARDAYLR